MGRDRKMTATHSFLNQYQINEFAKVLKTRFYTGTILTINQSLNIADVLIDNPNGTKSQVNNVEIHYNVPDGDITSVLNGGTAFKSNDQVLVSVIDDYLYKIFGFVDGLRQPQGAVLFTTSGTCNDIFFDFEKNEIYCLEVDQQRILKTNLLGEDKTYWTPQRDLGGGLTNVLVLRSGYIFSQLEMRLSDSRLFFPAKTNSFGAYGTTGLLWNTTSPAYDLAFGKSIHFCQENDALYILQSDKITKVPFLGTPENMTTTGGNDFCHDCAHDVFYTRKNANTITRYPWGGSETDWTLTDEWSLGGGMPAVAFNSLNDAIYFAGKSNGTAIDIYKSSFGSGTAELILSEFLPMRLKVFNHILYGADYNGKVFKYIDT